MLFIPRYIHAGTPSINMNSQSHILQWSCKSSILYWHIILDVINHCDHPRKYKKYLHELELWMEVSPPIRDIPSNPTSDWRYHLTIDKWGDWDAHMDHTGPHMFAQNYVIRVEQMCAVRWTCINSWIHVNILTKLWYQKRGNWEIHKEPHKGAYVCTQLCKGGGAHVWSQVDMHILQSDAVTHSHNTVVLRGFPHVR